MTSLECCCVAIDDLEEVWQTSKGLTKLVLDKVPERIDALIDFTPEGTDIWQVVRAVRSDGSIVFMGGNPSVLPVSSREMQLNCWRISGHRNHSRRDTKVVMDLLESGVLKVDELITHHFKLEDWEKAMAQWQQKNSPEPTWTMSMIPPNLEARLDSGSTRN